MHEYYGDNNVLNTLTLKTEGTKSTVQVCAKGFNIPNEDAQFMADLVPFERGANWSLKDCFEGNVEKGRAPVTEFINEVAKYPKLKETMQMIEGLICGRSIHASASYIFDDGYLKQNSRMRAPNGTWITAYNMEDSDEQGGLKIDTLTIQQLDKLHKTVDLLIEDGVLEDKGSIKANYDAYLHPDVLEYSDYKMWNKLDQNLIFDAFQFDSLMGKSVIEKTHPRSMLELSTANSLMRLMAQDANSEAPADTYKRYKNNISLWYGEMREAGLNSEEIEILKNHLGALYGVADTQEAIMKLSMDKKISGFDIVGSNLLRKAIAKKKAKLVEEVREKFYIRGKEIGTSQQMLDYVWNVQICRQLGYSFSMNHCMPYTAICIQCMNMVEKFGFVYWNCACLSVNSGGTSEDMSDNNTTDYGKVATAIGNMRKIGVKIVLPDINKARVGFRPDAEHDEIIYGLKAIQGIGNNEVDIIIKNRPYVSMEDFYNKMLDAKKNNPDSKFGDTAMIQLIKAGAFDMLENKQRTEIMKSFIQKLSKPVTTLRMTDIETLNSLGILTQKQKQKELRYYRYRNYVFSKGNFVCQDGKSASTAFYKLDHKYAEPYFYENFETEMKEGKDYRWSEDGYIIVKKGSFERVYDEKMSEFKSTVLSNSDNIELVNKKRFEEFWEEYASGPIPKWEMDSICCYYSGHELDGVDENQYSIVNYFKEPPTPIVADNYYYRGQQKNRFKLVKLAGTVIDRDKNKHVVYLLTKYGVVNIKLYKGAFTFYDKQIAEVQPDGTKKVLEKSWFKRGTKLLVTGYRREDQFALKKYKDSIYKHSIQRIEKINDDGTLILKSERTGMEDEEENFNVQL